MVVFIIAGHDTTALSLAWTLIELCLHPEVLSKLQSELYRVNPDPNAPFTQAHIPQLEYMSWVLNESMRLRPVAATASTRQLDRDVEYNGYLLPKGSTCLMPQYVLHRQGITVI
jgi:cytochrome P450 family 13